jgi:acetolactate synthase-1/2/3 large subunit
MTTAAELLAACLDRESVEYVFGVPGEENEDLLFALRDADVEFVQVRHEQGGAFMADVWGRVTGEAGVCLSTLGPGATNLLTGVADAHLDKSPLVAITGQGGLERLHQESHQAIDVVDTFGSVTKWNVQLNDPDIVHEAARKAFKLAEREKPGATHLEVPEDVAAETTEREPLDAADRSPGSRPAAGALSTCDDLFAAADRPIVLAGNGAVRTDAYRELRRLVETTGVPVVSTYMGKGAVSDEDPQSLMTVASGDDGEARTAVERADLVVAVGYDIAEHDPGDWLADPATPIVHVDSEAAEVYEDYQPTVELVADVERSTRALADRFEDCTFERGWYDDLRERIASSVDVEAAESAPFTVEGVLPLLREAMAPEDVLISDVGSHKMTIAENFPTIEPNTCIVSNGFASMGIAVPGAVAADLAMDANVVAATGDGGFLMNAAELETATRVGCSYTVVVFVDDDYRLISEKQEASRGEHFGTELTNPDVRAFAESFGVEAYRPERRSELRSALGAVSNDELSLVAVPLS